MSSWICYPAVTGISWIPDIVVRTVRHIDNWVELTTLSVWALSITGRFLHRYQCSTESVYGKVAPASGKPRPWNSQTNHRSFMTWLHLKLIMFSKLKQKKSSAFYGIAKHASKILYATTRDVKSREFFFSIPEIFFPGLDENARPRDDDVTPCWVYINIELPMRPRLLVRSCALLLCKFAASRLNIKRHYAQLQLGMLNSFIS